MSCDAFERLQLVVKAKRQSIENNYFFYFLLTIIIKVLISCIENPIFLVLDVLGLFIDKEVIFDKNKFRRLTVCRLSANSVIHITFFPFNLDTSPFQVIAFWT
jgi:hypothetical protein